MADTNIIEEIPIAKDPVNKLVPWIIALLVFLLCLVLSGASSIGVSMHKWQVGMNHRVSIEMPLQHEIDRDHITTTVTQYLKSHPGIIQVDVADRTKLFSIFGVTAQQAETMQQMVLPIMIDVTLNPQKPADMRDIVTQLQHASAGVRVETYNQWHDMLNLLQRSLQLIAYIFVMLIAVTVIVMISLVTKAGLAAHQENISILRLIGASNSYVAKKFQSHAFRLSARGGVIGFVLAMPVTWLLNMSSVYLGVPELLRPQVDILVLAILVFVPFFVVLLSVCVSRFAVLKTLSSV